MPSPETQREFAAQATDLLRQKVRRYAESRLVLYRRAGVPIPKDYATELVADALTDTWTGDEVWDPSACSLLVHLRGAILTRTWNEIRRARRFPRLSLDVRQDDPQWGKYDHDALEAHENAGASSGDCGPIVLAALTYRVCSALRAVAAADADALAMIACWEVGILDRASIIEHTGFTERVYATTRARLLRSREQLPGDLRDTAAALLRSER